LDSKPPTAAEFDQLRAMIDQAQRDAATRVEPVEESLEGV